MVLLGDLVCVLESSTSVHRVIELKELGKSPRHQRVTINTTFKIVKLIHELLLLCCTDNTTSNTSINMG